MQYMSWPHTLASSDPNTMACYCEGKFVVLKYNGATDTGYSYMLTIDGKLHGVVNTPGRIVDFILGRDRLLCACLDHSCIYVRYFGQLRYLEPETFILPLEHITSVSFTAYRSNPALLVTTVVGHYIFVFYGFSIHSCRASVISINGVPQEDIKTTQEYLIGITAVPHQMACFALMTPYHLTIYNSDGPYNEFVNTVVTDESVQSPLWFTTNQMRKHRAHLSYSGWTLAAHIEHGIVRIKCSFNFPISAPQDDWLTVTVNNTPVDLNNLYAIPPDDTAEYNVKIRANHVLTDVDLRAMTPIMICKQDGETCASTVQIPFMAKNDEVFFIFKPVTTLPGHMAAQIIEKLNIRVRAEIW